MSTIATTRKQLDETRARLAALSALIVATEAMITAGVRSTRSKTFLELNLAIYIAEYDTDIAELTEQHTALQSIATELGGTA
jgi:hypothetical protein